jgi:hypothetical protein
LISKSIIAENVCSNGRCQCSPDATIVKCDTKHWKNLTNIDFPLSVTTLTLIDNDLDFGSGKNERNKSI